MRLVKGGPNNFSNRGDQHRNNDGIRHPSLTTHRSPYQSLLQYLLTQPSKGGLPRALERSTDIIIYVNMIAFILKRTTESSLLWLPNLFLIPSSVQLIPLL